MMEVHVLPTGVRVHCPVLGAAGVVLAEAVGFELPTGQINVLTGDNGVGKSTLLRGIANALPGHAVVFKPEFGLRDELLVHQHLHSVLLGFNASPALVDSMLADVGLLDWKHERIGTLSSGQRARLGLCSLLAGQFHLWLLDEPLNALDAGGIRLLAKMVGKHLEKGGVVFVATHVHIDVLMQFLPDTSPHVFRLSGGKLVDESRGLAKPEQVCGALPQRQRMPWKAFFARDWHLLLGNPQSLLWGALFHWMVLSFFGLTLGKPATNVVQSLVWVSMLLGVLLAAKDWFSEDHRVAWLRFIANTSPSDLSRYWLVRLLLVMLGQMAVLLPVTALVALQFGLGFNALFALLLAMTAGIWAATPLLGLVSLLVMLTRGGAVLVYLLALPLLVPVLVFGLEASQASLMGRSPLPPLAVLAMFGLLMSLLGPALARRLIQLIQE